MTPAAPWISAPGKVFLAGEYAVLAGHPAVVAAVNRRARGRFVAHAEPSTPLVAEALRAVREHLAPLGIELPPGAPRIDSSALSDSGQRAGPGAVEGQPAGRDTLAGQPAAGDSQPGNKLGIGSSAAAAAVAVAALLESAGRDATADRPLTFTLADRAHRATQGGRGSGGDVAAAVFGGVISFQRPADAAPDIRPLGPPPGELVLFSAGPPRATVEGIRGAEALAGRNPDRYHCLMREIGAAADGLVRAWQAADRLAVVQAIRASGLALDALARDSDLPIWTEPVRAAAALAQELGGAAKPSGAGGGDVGLAFFADADAAQAFRARGARLDLGILNILIDPRGLARGD
jgi:phosphomevalonate kinase